MMNLAVESDFEDESLPTRVHESVDAYFRRMKETFKWLARKCPGNIVIAAHLATGAITRLILEKPEVSKLTPELMADVSSSGGLRVVPGSITTCEHNGEKWEFRDLDDAQFLWANRDASIGGALELAQLNGHGNPVLSCVASPAGSIVVSGSADLAVRVWDIRVGRCAATLLGHTRPILCCDVSPDGKTIMSASHDTQIKLWDPDLNPEEPLHRAKPRCTATLSGHTGPVSCARFSPDGGMIASASLDKTVRLWRPNGAMLGVLEAHKRSVRSCVWHPFDGFLATAGDDKDIHVWDTSSIAGSRNAVSQMRSRILMGHSESVVALHFSPDGKWLASGSKDNSVALWQWPLDGSAPGPASIKPKTTIKAHEEPINHLTFSRDSTRLVTASADGTLKVWDIKPTPPVCETSLVAHRKAVLACDFAGADMLVSSSEDNTVRLWDVSRRAIDASDQRRADPAEAPEIASPRSDPRSGVISDRQSGSHVESAVTEQRRGALTDVESKAGPAAKLEDEAKAKVALEVRLMTFSEEEKRAEQARQALEAQLAKIAQMRKANMQQSTVRQDEVLSAAVEMEGKLQGTHAQLVAMLVRCNSALSSTG